MTTVPAHVVALYEAAHYCIEQPGRLVIVLRIGMASPELSTFYREHAATSMTFITACNPGGKVSDSDNQAAMARLHADVQALGLVALPGTGRDGNPASDWPGEPSLAVFGISHEQAQELGQRYRQDAIVWAGTDAVPGLVMLR